MTVVPNKSGAARLWLQASVLIATGLWVYWPCLHGPWLWDDGPLIVDNLVLHKAHGLYAIWFSTPTLDYWPLTWTLLRELWQVFGNHPLAFHFTSLALHLVSALLLWRVLNRIGLRWGWLGALLFAVHPLNVESVAWISEIKNTLSLPLFLLSIEAYLDADEKKTARAYFLSVLLYLAAMLAKTSVIMLPFVLLLYSWWKRGLEANGSRRPPGDGLQSSTGQGTVARRSTATFDLLKITPYLAIALGLGLMTLHFQNVASYEDVSVTSRSMLDRAIGAGVAICFYLSKFLLPIGLLPIYPRWPVEPPTWAAILTLPLLAALLYGCWLRRKGWGRHALFGSGFFLVNILPVIGLVNMSYLNVSWVADHFMYLPMIGLIALVVAGVEQIYERLSTSFRPLLFIGITATLIFLATQSHSYAKLFGNEEAFWNHTLHGSPQCLTAHDNLGLCLSRENRFEEAREQFTDALKIDPNDSSAYLNLGDVERSEGHLPEAIRDFQEAIRLKPHSPRPRNNLAVILMDMNRYSEAIQQYHEIIQLDPNFANGHSNLAYAETMTGQLTAAAQEYREALKCDPDSVEAHNGLGNVLLETGQLAAAQDECEQALRLDPSYANAHATLGLVLAQMGRMPEAIQQLETARRLDPKNVQIQQSLQALENQKTETANHP